MTATDTFTSQTTTDLERSKDLLRLLAHGQDAGIAATAVGIYCIYCEWRHEAFGAEPVHEERCPILQARRFLRRVHAPRSSESGAGQSLGG